MDAKRLYATRDHMAQGEHYMRHVDAMTGEGLHAKPAIAAELAHRDIVIERQAAELAALRAERDALREDADRYRWLRGRVPGSTYRIMGVIYSEGGAGVDAAIDAARAGGNG